MSEILFRELGPVTAMDISKTTSVFNLVVSDFLVFKSNRTVSKFSFIFAVEAGRFVVGESHQLALEHGPASCSGFLGVGWERGGQEGQAAQALFIF